MVVLKRRKRRNGSLINALRASNLREWLWRTGAEWASESAADSQTAQQPSSPAAAGRDDEVSDAWFLTPTRNRARLAWYVTCLTGHTPGKLGWPVIIVDGLSLHQLHHDSRHFASLLTCAKEDSWCAPELCNQRWNERPQQAEHELRRIYLFATPKTKKKIKSCSSHLSL